MMLKQATDAQNLYDDRSVSYDDSWHVRFGRHMVEMASPRPGEKVLDLACGTGLSTFPAAEAIGSSGMVIGVDISSGMLAQAQKKLDEQPSMTNVSFYQHSIIDLDSFDILKDKKGTFDLISCCSALVLLPEPKKALSEWVSYLKPGGKLILDITHINSQLAGVMYERVGHRMGLPIPHYRLNFQKPDDLKDMMEHAGLRTVEVKAVAQHVIQSTNNLKDYLKAGADLRVLKEYSIDDADTMFESSVDGRAWKALGKADVREKAKQFFKEEWAKIADSDGKVREIDCVYVGLGSKP